MLENFFKRFKQDNGVAPKAETSPYVNIEGLEGKIKVPEPTKEDRQWAKKLKNATTAGVTKALKSAIEEGKNWRVWYLLNRPFKAAKDFIFTTREEKGFGGAKAVEAGLSEAAQHNNVTAAYLLLKYVEKNQLALEGESDAPERSEESVREEMSQLAVSGLKGAAEKPGSDVFALLAKTFSVLHDQGMHPNAPLSITDYQSVMKEAAIRAAAEENTAHLDAMLDNGLLSPKQFVEAYMASYAFEKSHAESREVTPQKRKALLDWLLQKGIVDQVFADEAAMVETRMSDAHRIVEAAETRGWKMSARDLPMSDGSIAPASAAQAEITTLDPKEGAVTFIFNYNAGIAHRLRGALVQEIPAEQVDQKMAEEGRQFLDSLHTAAPSLEWKKGEPFRLRFKPQPLPQP